MQVVKKTTTQTQELAQNVITERKQFVVNENSPVSGKDYSRSWKSLTEQEKEYAYHMSRAAFIGSLISSHQCSYESPILFSLAVFYFRHRKQKQLYQSLPENLRPLWPKWLAYWAGVVSNKGNYFFLGGKKFVSDIDSKDFLDIYKRAPHFPEFEACFGETFEVVWSWVDREIFDFGEPYAMRNLPELGGVTSYYSRNITSQDTDVAKEFCQQHNLSLLNTRVYKKESPEQSQILEISVASIQKAQKDYTYQNQRIRVTHGDFAAYLSQITEHLERALQFARDQNQIRMLQNLIKHYQTGDIELHKQSNREWLDDKNPPVESVFGFVETYVDPLNVRAEHEGIVAIVDREKSKKFKELVANSDKILQSMPWDKEYHLEKFQPPEFSSLDVIVNGCSWCFLGLNLPNYQCVRDQKGFKNLFLANNFKNYTLRYDLFISNDQICKIKEVVDKTQLLHVSLHELIGHGSGKVFMEDEQGNLNFDPENTPHMLEPGAEVSWYSLGETWNTKLGNISTSFEECRADTSALFLGYVPEAYSLFDISDKEIETVMWRMALIYFQRGLFGLKIYDPKTKKWGQAHVQGNYVIARYIFLNQSPQNKIVEIVYNKEHTDFVIQIDQSRLHTQGRKLVGQLLRTLQQYKSTGDHVRANQFYAKYSEVDESMLKLRDIVLNIESPPKMDLYFDIQKSENSIWQINKYPETHSGILQSLSTNFRLQNDKLIRMIVSEWKKLAPLSRVQQ